MADLKCSVIGLGKLGACMAAAIASKNIKVFGVDKDPEVVKAFKEKKVLLKEPQLERYLFLCGSRIIVNSDYRTAVLNSNISFVVVPTPSQKSGNFSLGYVKESLKVIAKVLAAKRKYHLVVITSTVLPGSMENV